MSRSNEQIKFKLSSGRKRSFLVLGPTASQRLCLCETTENKTCCWSPAAWPPSGTTHALHTLPCFSSQLCGRAVSAKDAALLPSSEEMGFWHDLTSAERVPTREDSLLMPFGMDFNSFWDLARDRGPYYLHLYPSWRLNCLTSSIQVLKSGKLKELKTH